MDVDQGSMVQTAKKLGSESGRWKTQNGARKNSTVFVRRRQR